MKNLILALSITLLMPTFGSAQVDSFTPPKVSTFLKGGIGTSWVLLPKVFLSDPNDPNNNWQILPATNNFTGYVGLQTVIRLGDYWRFAPELDYNYISGQVRVDKVRPNTPDDPSETVQKLQMYSRIEIPLNFGVVSSDNFWVSFGPVVYFTITDNKGFDNAVDELVTNPDVIIDSDVPVGVRFRIAIYATLSKNAYIDIKFDSDLGGNFKFEDNTYKMNMSMQSVTIGLGYRLKKIQ